MKSSFTFITLSILLLAACRKKDKPGDTPQAPNWEIVRNFHQDDSYSGGAKITVFNGDVFFSTFGHRGISPGSSGSLNEHLNATFFYQIGAEWYRYATTDEAISNLKAFNGELYGIRHRMSIKTTRPVIQYYNSYILFRWKNNNFEDIDTLEYTDNNLIEKSDIGNITLWAFGGKLHMVATTMTTARIWELSGNQLVKKPEEYNMSCSGTVATDNKEVAFTQVIQLTSGQDRTEYRVRGHYYNNNTFSTGPEYTFISEIGFNSIDAANYAAINSHIWCIGYENDKIKNYDNDQLVQGLSKGKVLRGDILVSNNGNLYMMLGDEKSPGGCAGLAIFDGTVLKEIPFVLPEPLDPCSKLIDATEDNGVVYLLLMNRFQYVIVRSK